jgi:hypothetical protein
MSVPRLSRVIIPVADIVGAERFYSRLLDQEGMRVSPGRHYFRCGDVTLALYCPAVDGDAREPRPNFDHVPTANSELRVISSRVMCSAAR